jgi:hypothetical protein
VVNVINVVSIDRSVVTTITALELHLKSIYNLYYINFIICVSSSFNSTLLRTQCAHIFVEAPLFLTHVAYLCEY